MEKKPFVTKEQLEEIAKTYPTPFYLYDEKGIRENAMKLKEAFSWNKGFRPLVTNSSEHFFQLIHKCVYIFDFAVSCSLPTIPRRKSSNWLTTSVRSSTWMISHISSVWRRRSERSRRRSAAVSIRADYSR